MSEQRTLASVVYDTKGKVTRRERFLREMDAVIPWATLVALVTPHYTVAGRGRRPLPLETMLRIYFLQQWFDLSDPQAEDMLYDSESMRRFARVELGEDTVPDESTILRFRHLLETHQLTAQMFDAVKTQLTDKRLLLKAGTIVDATIIAAPSSTKNATGTRDPEMKQTRKGQQWYFGMKVHVGTDTRGIVHSLTTTDAAQADITQLPHLVHGEESSLFGDKAYYKADDKLHWEAAGGRYRVNKSGTRTPRTDAYNAARSRIRARGEHAFHVVKRLWGFTKVRYRGVAKNTVRAFAAFTLANLYLLRKRLVIAGT
ncbi:MAG TPA: IS5 family transposase [Gemmatimonas sp.]|nr:IS5 family transposase [Gemmatimonas sp.]